MNEPSLPEESIFAQAIEIASPSERAAFLDRACGNNQALRAEVEALLRVHEQSGDLLDLPEKLPATIDRPAGESPGTIIGPYKLLEQIGEGGMGTVWMAEQTEPIRRRVAVKVVKEGMDSKQVLARFEAERQALALMDHPNIAKVYDGGQAESGRPYFVMELVKGVPITEYCDRNQLTARERLELFVQVCQAVQHAHQKGIIHRDVKPSNVLVSRHDSTPVVKAIDFGIAKGVGQQLTDKTLVTHFAQLIGTPLYMSPEQAGMSDLGVDTRSDIYSLGVLLYELLTGSTPFDKERLKDAGYEEIRRIIREEEPPKPSTRISTLGQAATTASANRKSDPKQLSRLFRGELDWIVMKALEKDRNRRYETASAFAADVQRYLHDEAVQACPPSAWYRLRKFARRNRGRLVSAGVLGLALLIAAAGIGWAVRDRAVRQTRLAYDLELALDRADLFQAQGNRTEAGKAFEQAQTLARQAPADPIQEARLAALGKRLAAEERDQVFLARFEEIRFQVQSHVNIEKSLFSPEAVIPEVREALSRYGIAIGDMASASAAAYVQQRPEPVRRELIAALYECLLWTPKSDEPTKKWLIAVLSDVDVDAWRARVRDAWQDRDEKALPRLAREADVRKQPVNFLLWLAHSLPTSQRSVRLDLLRRSQRAHPEDLWTNHQLAYELKEAGRPAEAVRYYTAALTLRPKNPGIYVNRGNALRDAGELDAAIVDLRQALALTPDYAVAHNQLGVALMYKGEWDEAVTEYRQALRLNKDYWEAHDNLGIALGQKGNLDEAIAEHRRAIGINKDAPNPHVNLGTTLSASGRLDEALAEFQEAVRLKPELAEAHSGLGKALHAKAQLDGAIAEYREAIRLKEDYAEAHCNLGIALRGQGRFVEALKALKRGHELGSQQPGWRSPSARWVQQCGLLMDLDRKLPAILSGKEQPADKELYYLAHLCQMPYQKRYAAAARFYEAALARDPKVAANPDPSIRYNAACAAALAGCGQGQDAAGLDDKERAGLRKQALGWLGAALQACEQRLKKEPDKSSALQHWLVDPDLAGVRAPEGLAKLPETERASWQKFWNDVSETLARARQAPGSKKP